MYILAEAVAAQLELPELLACSFDNWYPSLRQHSIPSTVLPLTSEFVDYLKADGVFVGCGEAEEEGADSWDEAEDGEGSSVVEAAAVPAPRFPSLEAAIEMLEVRLSQRTALVPFSSCHCTPPAPFLSHL